jgi:hypothetical protein
MLLCLATVRLREAARRKLGDLALHVFAVIDQDHHVVTRLYRVQPKRRSCQYEVTRFQCFAKAAEVATEPFDRFGGATSHRPQRSGIDGHAVDGNGQRAAAVQSSRVRVVWRFEITAPALIPLLATSSGSVFRGPRKTK